MDSSVSVERSHEIVADIEPTSQTPSCPQRHGADYYDGGELVVEDTYGAHAVTLPAGDMIL